MKSKPSPHYIMTPFLRFFSWRQGNAILGVNMRPVTDYHSRLEVNPATTLKPVWFSRRSHSELRHGIGP